MMRKFNITFFYTNFLYAETFVDLTLQAFHMNDCWEMNSISNIDTSENQLVISVKCSHILSIYHFHETSLNSQIQLTIR